MTSKERNKFRSTVTWKNFRLEILKERGIYCECCGMKHKSLTLHHRNMDKTQYTNLSDVTHFSLLCRNCHDFLHHIHTQTFKKLSNQNNPDLINTFLPFFILSTIQLEILKNRFDVCPCSGKYCKRGTTNK